MPLIFGLAWSRDGREVWFSGSETGSSHDRAIYALSLDGRTRLVARAPGALTVYDVSPDGQSALIATGAGWFGINASTENRDERALDLNGRTAIAGLSNDGRWLLAERASRGRGRSLAALHRRDPDRASVRGRRARLDARREVGVDSTARQSDAARVAGHRRWRASGRARARRVGRIAGGLPRGVVQRRAPVVSAAAPGRRRGSNQADLRPRGRRAVASRDTRRRRRCVRGVS